MKNYVISGSLGHISRPVVIGLVKAGKNVSVITGDAGKAAEIEKLGAKALVGSLDDAAFLSASLKNADVVYTMIPPVWKTDNWRESQNVIARNYVRAIKDNDIKYVVNLSSLGAHLHEGVGPVNAIADFEDALNAIPGLNVKHLRPGLFYYNFLSLAGMVKHAGILGGNYGPGTQELPLVHTDDIAAAALEELTNVNFKGSSFRYVVSDIRATADIAKVLGNAVGRQIPWVEFSDEDQLKGMLQAGVPATHAPGYVEMGKAVRTGIMQADLLKNKPALASVKLEQFAPEFAAAYNKM